MATRGTAEPVCHARHLSCRTDRPSRCWTRLYEEDAHRDCILDCSKHRTRKQCFRRPTLLLDLRLRGAGSDEANQSALRLIGLLRGAVIGRAFARPLASNDVDYISTYAALGLRPRGWQAGAGFRWCRSGFLRQSPISWKNTTFRSGRTLAAGRAGEMEIDEASGSRTCCRRSVITAHLQDTESTF